MAVPKLALDRPFTYLLPEDAVAGTGSLVSVPFHGRTVQGWIVGPAGETPQGRILPIRKVRSQVRFFDQRMLAFLRWVSHRYIAPLCTVIERSHPPRVVSEEKQHTAPAVDDAIPARSTSARLLGAPGGYAPPLGDASVLQKYGGPDRLLEPGGTTWLRPLPDEEADVCVASVAACVARGRRAIVLVPEAAPVPHTARVVLDTYGELACPFLGGEPRERYRTWLEIRAGRYEVVVSTRPGVFAPLAELGLIWISREVHPGHREDRAPYYHVRDVAMARAKLDEGACVLCSLAPSIETAAASEAGFVRVARPGRALERAAAPLVETTPPEAEDRSVRLARLLKTARSAALVVSRRGYGVARICRSCGEPARCAVCGGPIVAEAGTAHCSVCGAKGACAHCGSEFFGVERGGTERVAEWAASIAAAPVVLAEDEAAPAPGRVTIGTAAAVKDAGPLELDLVAILDADRALLRAGIHAGEQALATWMEAAAWATPRRDNGRVLVQTRRAAHPAVQALVRWEPIPFLRSEGARRVEAGFPPGHAVFRVTGPDGLAEGLGGAGAGTVLRTAFEGGTVCLVAVAPERLPQFRDEVIRMAAKGAVARVEAEPHV